MRSARGGRDAAGQQNQQIVPRAGGAATLPLLPLFDAVLLPGGVARVTIPAGWHKSGSLVELLLQQEKGEAPVVAAVPYLTGKGGGAAAAPASSGGGGGEEEGAGEEQLDLDRLHHTGTAARVLQLVRRTQAGGWTVVLEGRCRLRVRGVHLTSRPPLELYEAAVEQVDYLPGRGAASSSSKGQEELAQELLKGTRRLFVLLQGEEGKEAAARVARALSQQGPARMSDVLGSLVARALPDRLTLLSTLSVTARLQIVVDLQRQMLEVAEKAAASGALPRGRRGGRGGRLGAGPLRLPGLEQSEGEEEEEGEDSKAELEALMQRLKDAGPPPEVLRAAQREFKRLQRGSDQHPGYSMALSYLETLADLPWSRLSQHVQQAEAGGGGDAAAGPEAGGALPLGLVRQRLDEAHYGLDKIKERIVQFVAVQRLRGWDARAPILCFIGPPGVGKTSLARSIAEVLGRPFQRISLGGVRDEAEIRGHRRTYIGAMPGRLIQAVRKAGVRDPLLLLDEVDKMGRDARGDPAAALLEVLDPEQNAAFTDTYLGLPFDLSAALFVATANRGADIPPPLLDRLEVVHLGGYTLDEKVSIAERHLIPRLLAEHGLQREQLVFPAGAVRSIVDGYTSEAGVRSLSRCLAAVCRHVAVQVVQQQEEEQQQLAADAGGASDAVLGGIVGSGGSGGGGGAEPPMPLDAAAAGWAAAARPAVHRQRYSAGGGASGMQLRPLPAAAGPSSSTGLRLWAQLLLLASAPGAAAAAGSATGGYPWPQLRAPVRGHQTPAAAECICPSPRQPSWFSWLRRARHDPSAEQVQQHDAGCSASADAAPSCSCGDPECCCTAVRHGQAAAAASADTWRELGQAADTHSWEASWRHSRSAGPHDAALLLCGPGSMQVLPPAAAARHAAGTPGLGAALQPAPSLGTQQTALAVDGLLLGGAAQEAAQRPGRQQQVVVDDSLIEAVLGPRRYESHSSAERVASPGTAAGLVWTAVGGKLQYIECICVGPGRTGASGQLTLTGQLGDVLEESARIALSWVRAHAGALGLPGDASCPSRKWDVHIHLPAGAVPKDGPSAGITLAAALVSLFTGKSVRADTAMTGELTLRGLVLPVGGIKEKLLAAQAAGMGRVLVPARNMPDVQADVPAELRQALEVVACHRLEDVLAAAFEPPIHLAPLPLLARL